MANPKRNREAIRMLVMELGYREASERTGIKQSTLRQWATRDHWNATVPKQITTVATVTRPSDALADALREYEGETRVSFARASRNMAREAESAPLKQSHDALAAYKIAAGVHKWDQQQGSGILNVKVLAGGKAAFQVNEKQDTP